MLLQMSKKTFPVYRLKLQIKTEDQIKALVFPFWNHPPKNAISELSKNRISQTAFIKFHILVLSPRLILRKCYFFLPFPFKVEAASYLFSLTNNVYSRRASLEANSTMFCTESLTPTCLCYFLGTPTPTTLQKELGNKLLKVTLRSQHHWPLNKTSSGGAS